MSVQTNTTFALRLPFQIKSMKRRSNQQKRFRTSLIFSAKSLLVMVIVSHITNFAEKFANTKRRHKKFFVVCQKKNANCKRKQCFYDVYYCWKS